MQAIILAAGKSSRFSPFDTSGHKSSIKVLGKTILEHTLLSIKTAGIDDVIIVVSKNDPIQKQIVAQDIGMKLTFVEQPEALGMGDALLRAKEHVIDSFFLLHPSHVDFHEFASEMQAKQGSPDTIVLLAKKEDDVTEFGVLKLDGEKVVDIVEKPSVGTEPSHLRIIGVYLMPLSFFQSLENIQPEHYNLEAAISEFAKNSSVYYVETERDVVTLKYAWQLMLVGKYLLSQMEPRIAESAEIADNATIIGDVTISEDVIILEGACIKGPCYIGPGSIIGNNTLVRNGSIIEEKCVIGANMEVRNSIVLAHSKTHAGFVGDSIIGERCRIGTEFISANVRIDRNHVPMTIRDKKVVSGLKSLGVIIGHDTRLGVRVTTMPGVIIGSQSLIGPSTTVMKNVKEKTKVYTTFSETVEEIDK